MPDVTPPARLELLPFACAGRTGVTAAFCMIASMLGGGGSLNDSQRNRILYEHYIFIVLLNSL